MRFEKYIFVCLNERNPAHPRGSCGHSGAHEVFQKLKAGVKERKLNIRFRVNRTGCMETCELGPTIMIHPDNVWYGKVTVDDVDEIIESHLIEGKPVERLRADFSFYKK